MFQAQKIHGRCALNNLPKQIIRVLSRDEHRYQENSTKITDEGASDLLCPIMSPLSLGLGKKREFKNYRGLGRHDQARPALLLLNMASALQ